MDLDVAFVCHVLWKQGEGGSVQSNVRPEATPDDAWHEALARASRASARSITAGVIARLAAEDAARQEPQQKGGAQTAAPVRAAEDGAAGGGGLPEFKTPAEDDLDAALALQTEVTRRPGKSVSFPWWRLVDVNFPRDHRNVSQQGSG